MKSIRGGAFDTYFDNQATCQFQSGESPLARKHNIGFRLAVGVCDLVLDHRRDRRRRRHGRNARPSDRGTRLDRLDCDHRTTRQTPRARRCPHDQERDPAAGIVPARAVRRADSLLPLRGGQHVRRRVLLALPGADGAGPPGEQPGDRARG